MTDTGDVAYGIRPEAAEYPMMLVLSFVYPCNAKCPQCPYTNSNIRAAYSDAPFMSAEIFRKIADESGPYHSYLRISGGGEPMLHPQAVELLSYAKAVGCRIGLITNGSKFNEDNSLQLLTAGVDMIEFSVDACHEADYKIVRRGLKWDVLLANVRRMIALRDELKSASKIVASGINQNEINIDEVERFWVKEIGVDNFIKRKFLTWGDNTTISPEHSADASPYLDTSTTPCPFIFERLNIDSRGNIMVCGYDISANTHMGDVRTQSIRDIWLGPEFGHYRAMHLANRGGEMSLCSTCPDWKYRSWTHNYWRVVKNAEQNRIERLGEHDTFLAQSLTGN